MNALHPAMKALVAKELIGHADTDVKVAVASCISEITRITAPEAPYDDDLMKVWKHEHFFLWRHITLFENLRKASRCVSFVHKFV